MKIVTVQKKKKKELLSELKNQLGKDNRPKREKNDDVFSRRDNAQMIYNNNGSLRASVALKQPRNQ